MAKVKTYDPGEAQGRVKPRQVQYGNFEGDIGEFFRHVPGGASVVRQKAQRSLARGGRNIRNVQNNIGAILSLAAQGGRPRNSRPSGGRTGRGGTFGTNGPNFFDQIINAGRGVGSNLAELLRQQSP